MPNYNMNEKLRKKLLKDYDKMALPHRDQNGTTAVEFGLVINGIMVDETKQVLTLNAWTRMVSYTKSSVVPVIMRRIKMQLLPGDVYCGLSRYKSVKFYYVSLMSLTEFNTNVNFQ